MKAKEYRAKYFSDLTPETTVRQLSAMVTECFNEFIMESKSLILSVNNNRAICSKLDETNKKWKAIFSTLDAGLPEMPALKTETDPVDTDPLDLKVNGAIIQFASKMFEDYLLHEHRELHSLLQQHNKPKGIRAWAMTTR